MSSGELAELLEAIQTGKNHPLLLLWEEQRSYASRPSPTTTVLEQRSTCVWYVRALKETGLSLKQARELVSVAATKSGAFKRDVSEGALRNWEREAKEREKIEPMWLVVHHHYEPVRILTALFQNLTGNALGPSYFDYE